MAGWPPHKNKEESLAILERFIGGKRTFALELDGRVIGSLGIEKYNEEAFPELAGKKCREIGFVLSKEYWGRGLMAEAVCEVIRWLFEDVRLDIVLCGHFIWNRQSQRVQAKCGFRPYMSHEVTTKFGTVEKGTDNILTRDDWLAGGIYEGETLETKDLLLRKARPEDWIPLYRNIYSRPESARYMLWEVTESEEQARERIMRTIDFQKKFPYSYIVCLKPDREPIGFCAMRETEPGTFEETGIAIGPGFTGKGFGRQVLTALCEKAESLGAGQFLASFRAENKVSEQLLKTSGFEFVSESETRTDPRNGEEYTVINMKLQLR
jgi:ribosomal-protein-alanine N-acetyltransferase